MALWTEITRVCKENDCFKILGIGKSTTAMPTMDAINHEKLFKDFSIDRTYKIAWIELNQEAKESVRFIETVLMNRGMNNGMIFHDPEEAKQWLLEDKEFFSIRKR